MSGRQQGERKRRWVIPVLLLFCVTLVMGLLARLLWWLMWDFLSGQKRDQTLQLARFIAVSGLSVGILDNLAEDRSIDHLCLVDDDFHIQVCSSRSTDSDELSEEEEQIAIRERTVFVKKTLQEIRVLAPVAGQSQSLLAVYDLNYLDDMARPVYITGFSGLFVMHLSLIGIGVYLIRQRRALYQTVHYDGLTGLPNQELFRKEIRAQLSEKKADGIRLYLFDIVHFRIINMLYGHEGGDRVLRDIADRISDWHGVPDRLYRMSDDRFLLMQLDLEADMEETCRSITRVVDVAVGNTGEAEQQSAEDRIRVRIGILRVDSSYSEPAAILRDLEIALDYVKGQNLICAIPFDDEMRDRLYRDDQIRQALKDALQRDPDPDNPFRVVYHPQVVPESGEIVQLEALARFRMNGTENIPPDRFIAIAERNQLIAPLGRRVLEEACSFLRQLVEDGAPMQRVAVNVSLVELLQAGYPEKVRAILDRSGLHPDQLEIEVTETLLMDNYDIVTDTLTRLRAMGIRIAVDDFGTGYSSLSRLGNIPADTLKIDRSFIDGILSDPRKDLLTRAIITLAHELKLTVVAEGVESEAQKAYLVHNRCDIIQGFLISRPLDPVGIRQLLGL